jgi:spore coat polysaccharide biosynthesis protein SpsF
MGAAQLKASVIIQARMGSTRLPGKVMKEVCGKPLIAHMIERLRHAKLVETIVVATSTDGTNDKMCDLLSDLGVTVFRGSENDVLERFYETAVKYGLKYIVRLTADCPLIDPAIVDRFIAEFFAQGADHLCGTPRLAEGLDTEVFTFKGLEQAHRQATKKSEREHVTQYFHNNPNLFKLVKVENETDDSRYRITVDEDADFEVVSRVFAALYTGQNDVFGIEAIKRFLDRHPEIQALNSSIIRNEGLIKSLAAEQGGNEK